MFEAFFDGAMILNIKELRKRARNIVSKYWPGLVLPKDTRNTNQD